MWETPMTVVSSRHFVAGVPDRLGPLPLGASSIDFEHLVAKMDPNHSTSDAIVGHVWSSTSCSTPGHAGAVKRARRPCCGYSPTERAVRVLAQVPHARPATRTPT